MSTSDENLTATLHREKPIFYEIAYGEELNSLKADVNRLIDRGFEPFGSMVVTQFNEFIQPMIKFA